LGRSLPRSSDSPPRRSTTTQSVPSRDVPTQSAASVKSTVKSRPLTGPSHNNTDSSPPSKPSASGPSIQRGRPSRQKPPRPTKSRRDDSLGMPDPADRDPRGGL
jgi:hypothetical protein